MSKFNNTMIVSLMLGLETNNFLFLSVDEIKTEITWFIAMANFANASGLCKGQAQAQV